MKVKSKVWLLTASIIALIVAADVSVGYYQIEAGIRAELVRDAKDVRAMLMATRRVYHKQFLASGLPVDDKTVGFLPAHALSRISKEFSSWTQSGLSFNNVSDRPRNPQNMADSHELEAMAWFRANPKAEERLVEVAEPGGRSYYHYTAPIWIEPYCISCHGDRERAPASIANSYDGAWGYKVGDLRGVMSIKLPTETLRAQEYGHWLHGLGYRMIGYLALLVLLGMLLNRVVTRRLAALDAAANRFSAGDYEARSQVAGNDEIAALSRTFDHMAEAVQDREQLLRRLVRTLPDLVWIKDTKGVYLACNPRFESLVGATEADIIGRTDYDFFPSPQADSFRRYDLMAMDADGPSVNEEWVVFAEDGHQELLETTKTPMKDGRGQVIGVLGVGHAITEVREAQQQLAERQEVFRTIVSQAGEGIVLMDPETLGFVEFNEAACHSLGYTREEFARLRLSDLRETSEPDGLRKELAAAIEAGGRDFEIRHRTKEGQLLDRQVSHRIIRIKDKPYIAAVWHDVTESRRAQLEIARYQAHLEELVAERTKELAAARDQAESASRAKSTFLANMSHEIRTPMNAIIGLTHLMQRAATDPKQVSQLAKVSEAAHHLLQVINDILDLSKIEAGKLSLEITDFRLEDVFGNVVSLIGDRADAKGLEIIEDIDPALPGTLHGDPLRLGQVLINLAGNAVKFTEQGSVTLRARRLAGVSGDLRVRFEVEDSGIGMTAEERSRLFRPFEQADGSTTRKFGGTGLGLAIAARLVSLMDGEVGVNSTPGAGSTFWFTARFGNGHPSLRAQLRRADWRGRRALVVDDLPEAAEVIQTMVETLGLDCDVATSGSRALALIAAADEAGKTYDLLLIDWRMPGMDGIELAGRIKEMGLRQPPAHLLVTAFGSHLPPDAAAAAGFEAILQKPFTISHLHDVLAAVAPLPDQVSAAARDCVAVPEGLRGARILLAEDNLINREVAMEILRDAGVSVDAVENGQEAVERIGRESYDLILMDVQMPVMDGLEATRIIRGLPAGARIPILAMTANAYAEDREACLAAGMNDHVGKPVDPDQMLLKIAAWLPARPR